MVWNRLRHSLQTHCLSPCWRRSAPGTSLPTQSWLRYEVSNLIWLISSSFGGTLGAFWLICRSFKRPRSVQKSAAPIIMKNGIFFHRGTIPREKARSSRSTIKLFLDIIDPLRSIVGPHQAKSHVITAQTVPKRFPRAEKSHPRASKRPLETMISACKAHLPGIQASQISRKASNSNSNSPK